MTECNSGTSGESLGGKCTDRRSFFSFAATPLASFVILSGLVASCSIFYLQKKADKEYQTNTFRQEMNGVVDDVEQELKLLTRDLVSFGSSVGENREITRGQFNRKAIPFLQRHVGVQAIEWIPRVESEQLSSYEARAQQSGLQGYRVFEKNSQKGVVGVQGRDEYFPVYWVEPLEGNEAAVGFDLSSNPDRNAALKNARNYRSPIATAPITLVQEQGTQQGFLIFAPVFESKLKSYGDEQKDDLRQKNEAAEFLGFVLGVFRAKDFLEGGFSSTIDQRLEIEITDVTAAGAKPIFGQASGVDQPYLLRRTFDVAGRIWAVECWPTDTYLKKRESYRAYFFLAIGVLVSTSLGGLVYILARQNLVIARQVADRTKEIEQQARELTEARDRAVSSEAAKAEFLANMSHEIRTPMNSIIGFTELVLGRIEVGKQVEEMEIDSLETVARNAGNLLAIINDILDVSKIDAGMVSVEKIECSPRRIVEDVRALLEPRTIEKGLGLEIKYADSVPATVESDPTRIRQILVNLVSNAIKFTHRGGVEIQVRYLDQPSGEPSLVFTVIDTGVGIPEEQRERIFMPFGQADESVTREFGGTGLGLSISSSLSELLGGSLTVKSNEPMGSVFEFWVPVTDVGWNLPAAANLNVGKRKAGSQLDSLNILIVDDTLDNRKLIRQIFEQEGATVVETDNGQSGCRMALEAQRKNGRFDAVLMDIQMPGIDGYEATRYLCSQGFETPIVAVTARAMAHDQKLCREAGFADFVSKPVDANQLIDTLVRVTALETSAPRLVSN